MLSQHLSTRHIVRAIGEYHNHVQRFENVGVKELPARGQAMRM